MPLARNNSLSESALLAIAADVGLDLEAFKRCRDNPVAHVAAIKQDVAAAQSIGVTRNTVAFDRPARPAV